MSKSTSPPKSAPETPHPAERARNSSDSSQSESQTQTQPEKLNIHVRPDLPAIWFDNVQFTVLRDNVDGGQVVQFSFLQKRHGAPDSDRFELSRVITSVSQAKLMIKSLGRLLGVNLEEAAEVNK